MRICDQCGSQNNYSDSNCVKCGVALAAPTSSEPKTTGELSPLHPERVVVAVHTTTKQKIFNFLRNPKISIAISIATFLFGLLIHPITEQGVQKVWASLWSKAPVVLRIDASDEEVPTGGSTILVGRVTDPNGDEITNYDWVPNPKEAAEIQKISKDMVRVIIKKDVPANELSVTLTVIDDTKKESTPYLQKIKIRHTTNNKPIVRMRIEPSPEIRSGSTLRLIADVTEPDCDTYSCKWNKEFGELISDGQNSCQITFKADQITMARKVRVWVSVTDSRGEQSEDHRDIEARPAFAQTKPKTKPTPTDSEIEALIKKATDPKPNNR